MADATELPSIDTRLVDGMDERIRDLKTQAVWKRLLGAGALIATAGIAISFGSTVALVVATLVVAAVWLLPERARHVLGSGYLLRDRRGRIRFAAALHGVPEGGEQPLMFLADAQGHPRAIVALDQRGHPALMMLDEDQKPRLGVLVGPEGPVLTEMAQDGKPTATLLTSPRAGGSLELRGLASDTSRTFLWPAISTYVTDKGECDLAVDASGATMSLKSGEATSTTTVSAKSAASLVKFAGDTFGIVSSETGSGLTEQSAGSAPKIVKLP